VEFFYGGENANFHKEQDYDTSGYICQRSFIDDASFEQLLFGKSRFELLSFGSIAETVFKGADGLSVSSHQQIEFVRLSFYQGKGKMHSSSRGKPLPTSGAICNMVLGPMCMKNSSTYLI
jgi:hypothetical protein